MQNIQQRDRIFLEQFLPQTVVAGFQDFLQMLGHALDYSWQFLQLVRVFRQILDGFVHSGNQLRGFLVTAIAPNDGAVDLEELRGVAKDAGNRLVVHVAIIRLSERDRKEFASRRDADQSLSIWQKKRPAKRDV